MRIKRQFFEEIRFYLFCEWLNKYIIQIYVILYRLLNRSKIYLVYGFFKCYEWEIEILLIMNFFLVCVYLFILYEIFNIKIIQKEK